MKRNPLATAIGLFLALPFAAVQAQDTPDGGKKDDQQLEKVVVTGSLIPQAQVETAAPVIQITAEDIERKGFRNIYDALRNQPLATGAVQDNQFSGGFTPGANAVSLFGLDPGFTLVLINGHPLADYPLLYNGQTNFADISSIPIGMVDRIDILPGNQSSIYGSSAIAGVVNVILKEKVDGIELNLRSGGYSEGGGATQRLQLTGGAQWGALQTVYGVQLSDQHPIYGFQRSFIDSVQDDPSPAARISPRDILRAYFDPATGRNVYVDPGADACQGLSDLYRGTMGYKNRPGSGRYCGSDESISYTSLLNKERTANGYVSLKLPINDSMKAYADLLYNVSSSSTNGGFRFWNPSQTSGGYLLDANTGRFELYQKIFAPEEIGGLDAGNERNLSHAYSASLGLQGNLGGDWDYDAYYARSQFNVHNKQLWPLADAMQHFFEQQFLGPQLGEYYGYPIYAPDPAKFYQKITPAQYRSFQGEITSKSSTWTQDLSLQLTNTALFRLPAGDAGFAALVQAGDQVWRNPTDPRVVAGDFWGLTGTQGQGTRDRYAAAAELRLPIVEMLTADLSGRYDHYKNEGGGDDSKPTYKLGLEFRPTESLLLRGNYATAFRAPDMSQTFRGQSGSFGSVTDYYRCATEEPGTPIGDCTYNGVSTFRQRTGNRDLQSITAKSWGAGVVWSPSPNFDVKVDYYHIKIDDEVSDLDINALLRTESACRLGQLDAASAQCVDALARVLRSGPNAPQPNAIQQIDVNPINISNEQLNGVTANLNYRWDAGEYGRFSFGADYNVTLEHKSQQYPTDPEIDLLRDPFYSSEFKSIFTGTVSWEYGHWAATLVGLRYGATPNLAAQGTPAGYAGSGAGTVGPYMLYNGSLKYNATDDASIGLYVNNIKNSRPPKDPTWSGAANYPYYNIFNYSGYGRSVFLELDVKFGAKK